MIKILIKYTIKDYKIIYIIISTFNNKNGVVYQPIILVIFFNVKTKIIKNIIEIDDNTYCLLIYKNINFNLLNDLNTTLSTDYNSDYINVKSNVALASAITAYSRIHMIPYKLLPGTVYTDTDSIFTTTDLDPSLIGPNLGQMKDELKGLVIKEGYFLGIKQYGYWYLDKNNDRIEKSTFAGVTRNSLTWNEISELSNGKTISKTVDKRFFKSFEDLSITIKSI